jgi:hypothetical protein
MQPQSPFDRCSQMTSDLKAALAFPDKSVGLLALM